VRKCDDHTNKEYMHWYPPNVLLPNGCGTKWKSMQTLQNMLGGEAGGGNLGFVDDNEEEEEEDEDGEELDDGS
jgi:hypothetical protein